MGTRRFWTADHYHVWAATRAHEPRARATITTALWSRFVDYYRHLQSLPRRVRRAVQRQWACSLAGVALVFTIGVNSAEAAVINVNAGCTLINAINSANMDMSVGGCAMGSGADTIVLPAASTQSLTAAIASAVGPNGLPLITSTITIQGNGSTIARTGGPDFRLIGVGTGGTLTLQNLTLMGGRATGSFPASSGGAVYNRSTLALTNSTVSGNYAFFSGGGVYSYRTLTLARTLISGNTTNTSGTGREVDNGSYAPPIPGFPPIPGIVTANNFNLFGHSGLTTAQALSGFTPGANDRTATNNGTIPTALNAILASLAFNSGPTRTHALVSGSPAVDTVTNGSCPPPATDQRGFVRPVDGNGVGGAQCDSGAFEFNAMLPPVQNAQLTFMVLSSTRVTTPNADGCPTGMGFTAKFSFQAHLTNLSGMPALSAIKSVVTMLTSPRLVQNADGGAGGVGTTLTVPEVEGLRDRVLGPNESVDVPFVVCLPNLNGFQLKVNVVGVE